MSNPFYPLNLVNLPNPETFNVIWQGMSLQTYHFMDGFIEGVKAYSKEDAEKIKNSLIENLNRVVTICGGHCNANLFWDSPFSFLINWKDKISCKSFMTGGLIYHHSSREYSIHT